MLLFKHAAKVAKIVENTIDCSKNNNIKLIWFQKSNRYMFVQQHLTFVRQTQRKYL